MCMHEGDAFGKCIEMLEPLYGKTLSQLLDTLPVI